MNLSLKNARKLESAIKTLCQSGVDTTTKVRVKEKWTEIVKELKAGKKEVLVKKEDMLKLVELQYSIRRAIEMANEEKKLNEHMNKKAKLAAEITVLQNLATSDVHSPDELKDMIEHQKASLSKDTSSVYGRSSDSAVTKKVSVMDKETVEKVQKEVIAKQKEMKKIEDMLSDLNHSVKITLSKDYVSLLEKYNLA
jgi:hypothetical protein